MGKHVPVKNERGDTVGYWNPADYLKVACAMVPLLDKGQHPQAALGIAQRLLPAAKHRPDTRLKRPLYSPLYVEAMKQARAMSAAQRAAIVAKLDDEQRAQLAPPKTPKPAPVPRAKQLPPPPPRETRADSRGHPRPTSNVRHTDEEIALIARRVAHFQIDLKDTRPLSRLVKVAQAIELPPERHRTNGSIDTTLGTVRKNLRRVSGMHELNASLPPFDANRRAYIEPAEPVAPHNFAAEAADMLPAAQAAAAVAMPQSQTRPQEAPAPVQAPTPAPIPRGAPSDAIRAFGEAFASNMSALLEATTRQLMSELELRMSAMSERLMQRTVETLAAGVGGLVHSALEAELGGAVAAPQAPSSEAPFVLPNGSALPKALQCDVVGLIGSQVTEVREQLNGYAAGIRFINADDVGGWTPRRTVILNTKFISHNAENKCRKAGVKPIRVQGGAGAILNALRTICENEGISLAH